MIPLRPIVIWMAAVVLLLVGIAHPVFAGDGTTVDFSPFAELVRQYLSVGIDALLGAVLAWALRYLHLSGTVKAEELAVGAREFLHATAMRGLDRAQKKIAGPISNVDVGNAVAATRPTRRRRIRGAAREACDRRLVPAAQAPGRTA